MRLRHVPNAICILRLVMIPLLWALALLAPEARILFAVLLAFAFFTDQIDGYLLYAGKFANWVIATSAIYTFVFGPSAVLVYVMAAFVGYALLEEIALVCTRRDLDEHATSILARRRHRPEEG